LTEEQLATIRGKCADYQDVLVGARKPGESGHTFVLCAIASPQAVFRETKGDETHEAGGVFWYCQKEDEDGEGSGTIGFAPVADVELRAADILDSNISETPSVHKTGKGRLSWHVGGRAGIGALNNFACYDGQVAHCAASFRN
jgi:hypothetical protein